MSYLDNLKVKTSGVYKSPSSNYTKLNNEFIKLSSSGSEFNILPTPGIDLEVTIDRKTPDINNKNFNYSFISFKDIPSNDYHVFGSYQSGRNSILWGKSSGNSPALLNSTYAKTVFENCIILSDMKNIYFLTRYHSNAKHLFKNCLIFGYFDASSNPRNFNDNYTEQFINGTVSEFNHLNVQTYKNYGKPTLIYDNCLIKSADSDEAKAVREVLENIEKDVYKPSQVLPGLLNKYLPTPIS